MPYPAYINIDNIRFERYRRSQIGHGLRLSTCAYTQYVRMTSTTQVQYGK